MGDGGSSDDDVLDSTYKYIFFIFFTYSCPK